MRNIRKHYFFNYNNSIKLTMSRRFISRTRRTLLNMKATRFKRVMWIFRDVLYLDWRPSLTSTYCVISNEKLYLECFQGGWIHQSSFHSNQNTYLSFHLYRPLYRSIVWVHWMLQPPSSFKNQFCVHFLECCNYPVHLKINFVSTSFQSFHGI